MKTQKQLKAEYAQELPKVWGTDSRMISYCTKQAAYIIEHNGQLFEIEKPKIETRFCFGAGMYATCTDEEQAEASAMAQQAREDVNYFIRENMKGLDRWLEQLRKIREETSWKWDEGSCPRYMVITNPLRYHGQTEDTRLAAFHIEDTYCGYYSYKDSAPCWDLEFIDKLIAGYEQVKVDFGKRLATYLKRYGLSKVDSWTYIRD